MIAATQHSFAKKWNRKKVSFEVKTFFFDNFGGKLQRPKRKSIMKPLCSASGRSNIIRKKFKKKLV